MPCYLLHMVEMPDSQPYRDPDLKDVVGQLPQLFCAYCNPPQQLTASESARCLERDAPCWKPSEGVCEQPETSESGSADAPDSSS